MTPDQPPAPVLAHFAAHTAGLSWERAEPGFSGALVWRGRDAGGAPRVALKRWPPEVTAGRLRHIHERLDEAAHLPFVPAVRPGARGETVASCAGHLWDASTWLPGAPTATPTAEQARAACEAVARLHLSWQAGPPQPPRAVTNRLAMLRDHRDLIADPPAAPPEAPELAPLIRDATALVARHAGAAVLALLPWEKRALAARPCVRDLRAEHVLFEGSTVTGVVDYGALGTDTPATDLARLLGDWAAPGGAIPADALRSYRQAGAPLDAPDGFVELLARTGLVCSALGWLVRLRGTVPRPRATAARLAALLARGASLNHV